MSPLVRFWRNIAARIVELIVFWAVLLVFGPFDAENTRNVAILVVFCLILAFKTVKLIMALFGYWSITSRVRNERRRRGGA